MAEMTKKMETKTEEQKKRSRNRTGFLRMLWGNTLKGNQHHSEESPVVEEKVILNYDQQLLILAAMAQSEETERMTDIAGTALSWQPYLSFCKIVEVEPLPERAFWEQARVYRLKSQSVVEQLQALLETGPEEQRERLWYLAEKVFLIYYDKRKGEKRMDSLKAFLEQVTPEPKGNN